MMNSKHILLRPSSLSDAPLRYNWFCDPEFMRLYLGRPVLTSYRQVEEEIIFATYPAISTGLCELALQTIDTNLYIGNAFLRKIDWLNRSAEYGIFIGNKEQWGKKIGLEVTKLVLQYGFAELGLQRIWLTVLAYNCRAIKCFEKCDFQNEGVLRNAVFSGAQFHDVMIMSSIASQKT